MQAFQMNPKMSSMQGVFYPTGYAFVMFPDAATAERAAQQLENAGFAGQDIMFLTPHVVLKDVGNVTDEDSPVALPSVGTEGATVNKYINLAREGHHALMVKAPSDEDTQRLMDVVRQLPFSYGQKYHMLAMEDLE